MKHPGANPQPRAAATNAAQALDDSAAPSRTDGDVATMGNPYAQRVAPPALKRKASPTKVGRAAVAERELQALKKQSRKARALYKGWQRDLTEVTEPDAEFLESVLTLAETAGSLAASSSEWELGKLSDDSAFADVVENRIDAALLKAGGEPTVEPAAEPVNTGRGVRRKVKMYMREAFGLKSPDNTSMHDLRIYGLEGIIYPQLYPRCMPNTLIPSMPNTLATCLYSRLYPQCVRHRCLIPSLHALDTCLERVKIALCSKTRYAPI